MTDTCCCSPEDGDSIDDLLPQRLQRPLRAAHVCPVCRMKGKAVPGQTIKSLVAVSLRAIQDTDYLFCRTPTCPIVYFSSNGEQTFTVAQIRERVYQKEPDTPDTYVCYCFRHRVGDLLAASPAERAAILDDINTGINAGQCACDLQNPQGSCCLGNVRRLIAK